MIARISAWTLLAVGAFAGCTHYKTGTDAIVPHMRIYVPAGWDVKTPPNDDVFWLEYNDLLWVRGADSRMPPDQALVFCNARRIKDAPSTYCDLTRILHWKTYRVRATRSIELCGGRRGTYQVTEARKNGLDMVAETVLARAGGESFFAIYLRRPGTEADAGARRSISSICPTGY